jgi:hypothetical protein
MLIHAKAEVTLVEADDIKWKEREQKIFPFEDDSMLFFQSLIIGSLHSQKMLYGKCCGLQNRLTIYLLQLGHQSMSTER